MCSKSLFMNNHGQEDEKKNQFCVASWFLILMFHWSFVNVFVMGLSIEVCLCQCQCQYGIGQISTARKTCTYVSPPDSPQSVTNLERPALHRRKWSWTWRSLRGCWRCLDEPFEPSFGMRFRPKGWIRRKWRECWVKRCLRASCRPPSPMEPHQPERCKWWNDS